MLIYGKEFEKIWPKSHDPLQLTDFGKKLLKKSLGTAKLEQKVVNINEFKQKSAEFPLKVRGMKLSLKLIEIF